MQLLFAHKKSGPALLDDSASLAVISYDPHAQMSVVGGVPLLDAGAAALAATAHTTTSINSEDTD